MAYAKGTKVEIEQTRVDIERTLARYGSRTFSWHIEDRKASLQFMVKQGKEERRIRFDLPLPGDGSGGAKEDRARREKWRALLLCIKAKLESVEAGIETFEEAFLAHVVMPDGATVYRHAKEGIALAYTGGHVGPLLPALPAPSPGNRP